jgi:hypothetical protein
MSEISDGLTRGGLSLALLECDYVGPMEKAREECEAFRTARWGEGVGRQADVWSAHVCKIPATTADFK